MDGFYVLAQSTKYTHSRGVEVVGRRYTVVENARKGVNIPFPLSLDADELMDDLL